MYVLKMMGGDKFEINDEDLNFLANKTGMVAIPSIKAIINLSSVSHIVPKDLDNKSSKERLLHDGTYAIQRGGVWVMKSDPNVRLDIKYFPELRSEAEQAKYDQVRLEREEQERAIAEINRKRLTN